MKLVNLTPHPIVMDVVAPDTGSTAFRDEGGRVVSVQRFVRN